MRFEHSLSAEEARQVLADASGGSPNEESSSGAGPVALILGAGALLIGVLLSGAQRGVIGCPNCGQKMDVSEARRQGAQVVECPSCRRAVLVPQ